MQDILQRSNSALRWQEERQAKSLDNNRRLQTTFARAAALLEAFPRGTERSPPSPAYDPLQGIPSDSTPLRPNAPVSLGEATRDGVELPAAPGRVVTAAGPMGTAMWVCRNLNRFMITPIPMTPQSEVAPKNPLTPLRRHLHYCNLKCLFKNRHKTQTKHHIHSNFFLNMFPIYWTNSDKKDYKLLKRPLRRGQSKSCYFPPMAKLPPAKIYYWIFFFLVPQMTWNFYSFLRPV